MAPQYKKNAVMVKANTTATIKQETATDTTKDTSQVKRVKKRRKKDKGLAAG